MQYLTELEATINDALHKIVAQAVTENKPEQEAMG